MAAAALGAPAAVGHAAHKKFAAFWPQNPALWFAQAECQFRVKAVSEQFDRYCHLVLALPHESLRLVADLVEAPPTKTPYDDIKQRLVALHQLSDFQKAEKLFLMQPLGSRKPSEMMAAKRQTYSPVFFCRGCPERFGCYWPGSTTRTPRPWPSKRTSCGPFMTAGRRW